ncbi:sensor histidine kinase, partial [bacterium]|nr:sensor histidine kinase [bacterium]
AEITLDIQNHQLTVEVSDNGVGFDTNRLDNVGDAQHGFGLFSIRERLRYLGGHMELQSTIGQGTTVRLSVTLEPK